MSTIPGLFVIGEANFSDHGANRLGASALMQGLSDGYFILPYTIGDYLANTKLEKVDTAHAGVSRARKRASLSMTKTLLAIHGHTHRGFVPSASWARSCGTIAAWRATAAGLKQAIGKIRELREEYLARRERARAAREDLNQSLEKAGRVADFFELAELMCLDALRSQRILRRAFPRRISDAGRRSAARRRSVSLRRGLGISRARTGAELEQGTAARSNTCIPASGATNNAADSARLAAEERDGARAHGALRSERRESRHVVAGDAGRGERRI